MSGIGKVAELAKKHSDLLTTGAGLVLGAVQAANVDLTKLLAGGVDERNKAITAVGLMVLGWLTNKRDSPATKAE